MTPSARLKAPSDQEIERSRLVTTAGVILAPLSQSDPLIGGAAYLNKGACLCGGVEWMVKV